MDSALSMTCPRKPPKTPHRIEDNLETEWQFSTNSLESVESWLLSRATQFGFTVEPAPAQNLSDTYFDTKEWHFFHAGYKFRLRQNGPSCQATFKKLREDRSPLQIRREISQNIPHSDPQSLRTAKGLVADWVRVLGAHRPITPLFKMVTNRKCFRLLHGGEAVAEVCLDQCRVFADDFQNPVLLRFVELEGGKVKRPEFRAFVRTMQEACALARIPESKFATGLHISHLHPPPESELPDLQSVTAATPVADFIQLVLKRYFVEFLQLEPGARLGEDREALHQMRVATRRMRAALRLFQDFLPVSVLRYRESWRWITNVLGPVRDLDVKLEQLDAWRAEAPDDEQGAFAEIAPIVFRQRALARKRMLRSLDGNRYARLTQRFAQILEQGPAKSCARHSLLGDVLPNLVEPLHRKVLKAGKRIKHTPDLENYHRLRIAAKKLRYALEFSSPLSRNHAKNLRKRLVKLQDVLGQFNDAHVAIQNVRALLATQAHHLSPNAIYALGRIEERYHRLAKASLDHFPPLFKQFKKGKWEKWKSAVRTP